MGTRALPWSNPGCLMAGETLCLDPVPIRLLQRVGGDKLVREMIDIFLAAAPKRLEACRSTAPEAARKAFHALKSSAGQLGARELGELAARMEKLAERGAIVEMAVLRPEFERLFALATSQIAALRSAGDNGPVR